MPTSVSQIIPGSPGNILEGSTAWTSGSLPCVLMESFSQQKSSWELEAESFSNFRQAAEAGSDWGKHRATHHLFIFFLFLHKCIFLCACRLAAPENGGYLPTSCTSHRQCCPALPSAHPSFVQYPSCPISHIIAVLGQTGV